MTTDSLPCESCLLSCELPPAPRDGRKVNGSAVMGLLDGVGGTAHPSPGAAGYRCAGYKHRPAPPRTAPHRPVPHRTGPAPQQTETLGQKHRHPPGP